MIKKTLIVMLGTGLAMGLLLGRDASSYVRTSFGWMKSSVKNSVPIEFEIERARQTVKNLMPDIRKSMHVIAQEEVEIERLDKDIAQAVAVCDRERAEIKRMSNDLELQQESYTYGGRSYPAAHVKVDLANRFERFKMHETTLASKREILIARRKGLDAARQKLEGMLVAKRQLEVQVENLEARFKNVEVMQTASQHNIDDSQLGRVKDLIADIRTRLSVAERMATADFEVTGEIPVSEPAADDILQAINEYFSSDRDASRVAELNVPSAN